MCPEGTQRPENANGSGTETLGRFNPTRDEGYGQNIALFSNFLICRAPGADPAASETRSWLTGRWAPMRRRGAVLAAVLSLAAAPGVAQVALPTRGTGLVSDGASQIALFTADGTGVEVYDTATGKLAGQRVALPAASTGELSSWDARGIVDGRVYLRGGRERTELIAVADTRSGTFRFLCGASDQLPAGVSAPDCLRFGINGPHPQILRIGKRWMEIPGPSTRLGGTTLIRYTDSAGGLTQRFTTRSEEQRYQALLRAGATVDLDATRVQELTGFGYRALSRGRELRLGRTTDRRLGRLRARRPGAAPPSGTSVGYPSFGARGLCATTSTRLTVWDKRTRRIWTRTIPRDLRPPAVACTKHGVVIALSTVFNPRPPISYSILSARCCRGRPRRSATAGARGPSCARVGASPSDVDSPG